MKKEIVYSRSNTCDKKPDQNTHVGKKLTKLSPRSCAHVIIMKSRTLGSFTAILNPYHALAKGTRERNKDIKMSCALAKSGRNGALTSLQRRLCPPHLLPPQAALVQDEIRRGRAIACYGAVHYRFVISVRICGS